MSVVGEIQIVGGQFVSQVVGRARERSRQEKCLSVPLRWNRTSR